MHDDLVLYETDGNVGYVTLNRPDKLNAISEDLRIRAEEAFDEADADPATRVVVLRGAGRAFSAGYDLSGADPDAPERRDALWWDRLLQACADFEMKPFAMKKPVIASVRGYAVGGGCELAMFCDLTICSESAKFGEPEIRFSNPGPGLIMPFIIGHKRARELLYMGDLIDARTALEWGMVNRVVPDEELDTQTRRFARRLAAVDPEALYGTKLALRRGMEAAGIRNAMDTAVNVLAPVYAARTQSGVEFKKITKREGLRAALAWRHAHFEQ